MRDSMAILEAINLKEAKVVNAKYDDNNAGTWTTRNDIIPLEALRGKKTLSRLSFPEIITYIGGYAFYGTRLSGALIIPTDVEEIAHDAFAGSMIGNVSFPGKLKKIDTWAFGGCSALSGTLVLPESLSYIGDYAFYECAFTGSLILPKNFAYYCSLD